VKERSAATTLRHVFARVTAESRWASIAENSDAQRAVHAFVEESRAGGGHFREVIIQTLALSGAAPGVASESAREVIAHWVVQAFYPLWLDSSDGKPND
jgi:hypothetical protein